MRTTFSRLGLFLSLTMVCIVSGEVAAQTSIAYTSSPTPINYGASVTYTLVGPQPGSITSVTWTYQNQDQSCRTSPGTFGTGTSVTVPEAYPGTFTIWAYIVYGGASGVPSPNPKTLSTSITVPPPDALVLNSGNNVTVPLGQYNPTTFIVYSKGVPVSYNGTFVQELITEFKNLAPGPNNTVVWNQSNAKTDWVPASGGDPKFSTSGSLVTDNKFWPGTGNYVACCNLAATGQPFGKCKQSFRFAMRNSCNVLKTWPCSTTYSVSFINDGNGNYSIGH